MAKRLQTAGTEEEMREVAARICRNYLPGLWQLVTPQELQFRRISGGLSNYIYFVGLPEDTRALFARAEEAVAEVDEDGGHVGIEALDEPKKVLLRIYGQVHGDRAMDAIVTESVIFTLLSERRLGPKLFGVFSGGRIEEYIPSRSLTTRELSEPAISMKIAEKAAAIHSMEIPLGKEPTYVWKTMAKWLRTSKEVFANTKGKNEAEQVIINRLKDIDYEAEIEWLKKYIVAFESPVVFCHNDLQEGNILLLEDDAPQAVDDENDGYESNTALAPPPGEEDGKKVDRRISTRLRLRLNSTDDDDNHESNRRLLAEAAAAAAASNAAPEDEALGEPKLYLIDFEYCAYNYRGFDIANHFQEWAYDYTNPDPPYYWEFQEHWPTLEQKEIFIRSYLWHADSSRADIDAVNRLLAETDAFALASHLFWGLWALVNASKSSIPFGYWEYGNSRMETYLRLKQEVIKKDKFGLPLKRKIEEVDI